LRRLAPGAALVAALLVIAGANAASASPVAAPPEKALYVDGPDGRYLMNGEWLIRKDPRNTGVGAHWFKGTGTAGWQPVTVPSVWNANNSVRGLLGEPVWYRKDFVLPDNASGLSWLIHFDSVNYRATVWLNGHRIGAHTGPYLPFELPLTAAHRGANHLVVRVDNRLRRSDLGQGGWWNYGGIPRDVYLRRVDRVDFTGVQVRPTLGCPTCDARVDFAVDLTSYSGQAQSVHLTGSYGDAPVDLGTATIPARGTSHFVASVPIPHPHLWSPTDPYLYTAKLSATVGGQRAAGYTVLSGIRTIAISPDGRLMLNGRYVDFRGVAIHEDSPARGNALTPAQRDQVFSWMRTLGATEMRAHYPLSPYMYEQADRLGILMWSEIPVYRVKTMFLRRASVQAAGLELLRANIATNQNHPSVYTWSVGNELNQTARRPIEAQWLARAAALAKALDPTRPVAYSIAGVPRSACGARYGPIDVIGVSDYYGWYNGPTAHLRQLSRYLDSVRACEPTKAIVVSEFGAEANRNGRATQKGTYQFQTRFVQNHEAVYVTKPWLSGVTYFTLQEFRVGPGWSGGNPKPDPPWHQKGLISRTGVPKPAFYALAQLYAQVAQFPAP
jgi:beta-glucuronidase